MNIADKRKIACERGYCPRCLNTNKHPENGRKACQDCAIKARRNQATKVLYNRSIGKCSNCGSDSQGYNYCLQCKCQWRRYASNRRGGEHKYTLGRHDYIAMLEKQKGKCLICKGAYWFDLCVDHCHKSGKVRGLLCSHCNVALGHFRDDIKRLSAAIKYLSV